jgi:NADPH-dependent curcumin reductase CurA
MAPNSCCPAAWKPRLTDLGPEETAIPTPTSKQLLLGVPYLSLDPYMAAGQPLVRTVSAV